MLRIGVQGVEVVVVISCLIPINIFIKYVEIFLDDSTSMIDAFTWWITFSNNTFEGLVVDIIQLDIIFKIITITTEQINRPRN